MKLILISGLSGSGKSVALNLLEDAGYYCVDNLPVAMLTVLARMMDEEGVQKVAVAIDARSGHGIDLVPQKLETLKKAGIEPIFLFLFSHEETLLKRYSESRRRHPLATAGQTLLEAIRAENLLLEPISTLGHRIDTSGMKASGLREWVRQFIEAEPGQGLTLMFESFGFKHGLPLDADLVFDVRCLPNPHWVPELRPLTGNDAPVIATPAGAVTHEDAAPVTVDALANATDVESLYPFATRSAALSSIILIRSSRFGVSIAYCAQAERLPSGTYAVLTTLCRPSR